MTRVMTLVALTVVVAFGCGKKDGKDKPKGDPALVAAAQDVAKRYCECPTSACASEVKSKDGHSPMHIFMKTDTKNLTDAEMKLWQDARHEYNECGKPSYKRSGADTPPVEGGAEGAEGGDKAAEGGDKAAEGGDKAAEGGDKAAEGGDKAAPEGGDKAAPKGDKK